MTLVVLQLVIQAFYSSPNRRCRWTPLGSRHSTFSGFSSGSHCAKLAFGQNHVTLFIVHESLILRRRTYPLTCRGVHPIDLVKFILVKQKMNPIVITDFKSQESRKIVANIAANNVNIVLDARTRINWTAVKVAFVKRQHLLILCDLNCTSSVYNQVSLCLINVSKDARGTGKIDLLVFFGSWQLGLICQIHPIRRDRDNRTKVRSSIAERGKPPKNELIYKKIITSSDTLMFKISVFCSICWTHDFFYLEWTLYHSRLDFKCCVKNNSSKFSIFFIFKDKETFESSPFWYFNVLCR